MYKQTKVKLLVWVIKNGNGRRKEVEVRFSPQIVDDAPESRIEHRSSLRVDD